MIRRVLSLVLLLWALGFALFALLLPRPVPGGQNDAVVVLTGGGGRIPRALEVLRDGRAERLLVAGVDREVTPTEFAAEYEIAPRLMSCCITLDQESVDTRSNAREAARWLDEREARSVRLVTSDWHMRRAAWELDRTIAEGTTVVHDAVPTRPSLKVLFVEYNKLLARWAGDVAGI